jgi:hypothetical protein
MAQRGRAPPAHARRLPSNSEADRLKGVLQAAKAELWAATEHIDELTAEWKDATAPWCAREKAQLVRARDANAARHEFDSLRCALERAVEEANTATKSLKLATTENARLQDVVAEKESALEVVQGKLNAVALLDSGRAVGTGRMDQMFASLSNLTELKSAAAAAAAMDDYSYEFDHFDVEKVFDIMPLTVSLTRGARSPCH